MIATDATGCLSSLGSGSGSACAEAVAISKNNASARRTIA